MTLVRRAESTTNMAGKSLVFKSLIANWKRKDLTRTMSRAISIPATIARQPSSFAILVLIAVFNGIVNMILSSLGSVFQSQYGFPPTTAGLSYLGLGIGGVVGLVATPRISDFFGKYRIRADGSKGPQHVLPVMIIAGPVTSIGLLWYGWSTEYKVSWIVPIIGLCLFGFGFVSIKVCSWPFATRFKSAHFSTSFLHRSSLWKLFPTTPPLH
jgi:predicted MFS family arabinose efflux permease